MSRVVSMFGSKVYRDIGHTLASFLVFTVQEDLGPWTPFPWGIWMISWCLILDLNLLGLETLTSWRSRRKIRMLLERIWVLAWNGEKVWKWLSDIYIVTRFYGPNTIWAVNSKLLEFLEPYWCIINTRASSLQLSLEVLTLNHSNLFQKLEN